MKAVEDSDSMDHPLSPHRRLACRLAVLAAAPALALMTPALALAQAPAGTAPGQSTGILAPKLPDPGPAPVVTAPPSLLAPSPPTAPEAPVLVPALKGLLFVAGAQAVIADGVGQDSAGEAGVAAPQLPILNDPKFQAQMKGRLGKPVRLADIQQIRDETKAWYVAHERPFVEVVVPPQNISSGVIQVVVSEFRLGDVEVAGARYFKKSLVLAPVDLKRGQVIGLKQLQANVDRLNDNPFLSVDAEFQPGKVAGTTDLVLRAKDRLPVRVYAGYDNQGVPLLDRDEWNVGINWGNAFGTGQILSYQYTRAFNGRFTSHSASDVIRLNNTDKLLLFGNYGIMRTTAYLLTFFGPLEFNSNGHTSQASVRYVHALPRWRGFSGHIQAGYDYKATDNNSFFGQLQLGPPSVMETHQFPIVLDAVEVDRWGSTSLENDLVFAPGRLSAHNNDASFQLLVAGAQARYVYDRLSITRTTRLPADYSLILRANLQRSSGILPNSEQLGGGGVGSVRGYYPSTGLGSDGELFNVEVRAPAFSLGRMVGRPRLNDLAQVGVFYDAASLRQPKYPQDLLTGAPSRGTLPLELASTGAFLHYSVARNIDFNLDMGFQLRRSPDSTRLSNYAAVAIIFSN